MTSADERVYEVNLAIDADIAPAYRAWLGPHVHELLALPGFVSARVFEVLDGAPDDGRLHLCVQYVLRDTQVLETYLREYAPRMRADGVARFGERFHASRRVLRPLDA